MPIVEPRYSQFSISRIIHPASFRGIHNMVKVKCLLALLYNKKDGTGLPKDLTVHELHLLSGCNEHTIKGEIAYWVRWKYVIRNKVSRPTKIQWGYHIAAKGERYINYHYQEVVKIHGDTWKNEIAERIRRFRDPVVTA